jgi:hypothetical protein
MDVMTESLKQNFEALELPPEAVGFLLDLWNAIQVFDDVADNDEVKRGDLNSAIWSALAGIQLNPFYGTHQALLLPVISLAIVKWLASDEAERAGNADARSYMWRAGYYDVVCMVNIIIHGPTAKNALNALGLYGETFEEYKEEFGNA